MTGGLTQREGLVEKNNGYKNQKNCKNRKLMENIQDITLQFNLFEQA